MPPKNKFRSGRGKRRFTDNRCTLKEKSILVKNQPKKPRDPTAKKTSGVSILMQPK